MIPSKSRSYTMFAALAMRLNPVESEATAARGQRRPWSLVARLAAFYTLGTTALLLVTMVVLYGVFVRYSDANDTFFLNDKWRAVRADLAVKKANQGELLAEEVASETSDYFVRVLDRRTGKVLAESPEMRKWLSPSVFPVPPSNGYIPEEGTEYKTSTGKWFLLMSAFAEIDRMMPRQVVLQIAQDRSDDKAFADFF